MRVNRRWIALVVSAGLLVVLGAHPKGGEEEPKPPPASLHDSFETAQVACIISGTPYLTPKN
jgi:hypothetical protein